MQRMSIFTKVGPEAAAATNDNGGGSESPIVSFKSGSEYKVAVKSVNDVAEYYGYGIFGKVNTFVPKNPPTRSAKGFVTGNPSAWDRAAEALYADAKAAEDAGNKTAAEEIRKEAGLYRGKKRYLRAFYDLTAGKYIVVDLSPNQEAVVKAAIAENEEDLGELAFKLTKKGSGQGTVVSLSPIVKVARDLSADEQAKLAELESVPDFDLAEFESCLYIADEAEQAKNLVTAGFDISRIGLTVGSGGATSAPDDAQPPVEIEPEDLPF